MKTFVLSFKVVITLVILLSCQRDLSPLQMKNGCGRSHLLNHELLNRIIFLA
jgi:hypothetical protein